MDAIDEGLQELDRQSANAIAKTVEAKEVHANVSEAVEGVSKWTALMERRMEYLAVVMTGNEGDLLTMEGSDDDEYLQITALVLAIEIYKATSACSDRPENKEEVKNGFIEKVKTLASSSRLYAIALRHGWQGSDFRYDPDLDSFLRDVKNLGSIRTAEVKLEQFLKGKSNTQDSAPVEEEDIGLLEPLVTLKFYGTLAEQCTSEESLKKLKKLFDDNCRVLKDLFAAITQAAAQVTLYIERRQARVQKAKDVEVVRKQKEQEKNERLEKAKAEADKKKEARLSVAAAAVNVAVKPPSQLLIKDAPCIKEATTFADKAAFDAWLRSVSETKLQSFEAIGPYAIKKVSLGLAL
jgi:hypothetical protein